MGSSNSGGDETFQKGLQLQRLRNALIDQPGHISCRHDEGFCEECRKMTLAVEEMAHVIHTFLHMFPAIRLFWITFYLQIMDMGSSPNHALVENLRFHMKTARFMTNIPWVCLKGYSIPSLVHQFNLNCRFWSKCAILSTVYILLYPELHHLQMIFPWKIPMNPGQTPQSIA